MSLLLASCSATSDPDAPFGFAGATGPDARQGMATDAFTAASLPTIMDEDDPALPQDVALLPAVRDGSAPAASASPPQAAAEAPAPEAPAAVAAQPPESQPPQEAAREAEAADGQPAEASATQVLENPAPAQAATTAEPTKRGFLSSLFAPAPAHAATAATRRPAQQPTRPVVQASAPARPIIQASARPPIAGSALPGVRADSLFEIKSASSMNEIDAMVGSRQGAGVYQVASAAGLARLAPNGLAVQHEDVEIACLQPSLVRVLQSAERHFGRKIVVTSGYRSPERNRRARGARNSLHMNCAAADVQMEGVNKTQLASYFRSMPGRGGVGTYCHTESVHVDVGSERDWNWRCRRR